MEIQPSHERFSLWNNLAARAGLALSIDQHAGLSQYLDILLAANRTMNLTRITDPDAAKIQHIGDGLTLLPHVLPRVEDPRDPTSTPPRLADIGAGGGVPGIPLAIARPDIEVVLIESTAKKADFLRKAIEQLHLSNATVLARRAEDVGQSNHRESFDFAVARAVARMVWLAEWCLPLVRKGGKMLAMKGPKVAEEMPEAQKAIKLLGGGEPIIHPVDLPETEHHLIVEIPKIGRTNPRYPRPATRAKGRPIS
jgi:16S rRNA (guanine527-N7)-methyltransferase